MNDCSTYSHRYVSTHREGVTLRRNNHNKRNNDNNNNEICSGHSLNVCICLATAPITDGSHW